MAETKNTKKSLNNNDVSKQKSTNSKTSDTGTLETKSGVSANNFADGKTPKEAGNNQFLGAGLGSPVIRINDHYFSYDEIQYFSIKSEGFVPTMELHILTSLKDLSKQNIVKDGDKCAIFINSDLAGVIRSLRCDFLISNVEMNAINENIQTQKYSYIIFGELYIPNLRNEIINYAFNGSSRDAIRDAAKRISLGFYFNDSDDTQDTQIWQCTPSSGGPLHFIQDVTAHAWGGNDYFYNSWIDFRYALTFLNVSKMLGTSGLDQGMDITKFVSIAANTLSTEGKSVNSGHKHLYNYKLFNNIYQDADQFSTYYVLNYKIVNKSFEITREIGLNISSIININNNGTDTESNTVDINAQIVYNHDKVDSGNFYILTGPGTNTTYKAGDNGDYTLQQAKTNVPVSQDTFSTGDASTIKEIDSNEYASGNVSQTYELANVHNYINNKQLEKMYIDIETPGCNLSIVRGEKVPMLLIDRSSMNRVEYEGTIDKNNKKNESYQKTKYDITGCGWFLIDAITYEYNPFLQNVTSGANSWITKIRLTRREWPSPVAVEAPTIDSSNNTDASTENKKVVEAVHNINITEMKEETTTNTSSTSADQESFEGLKYYMVDIYNSIKEATNDNIMLVSGRRWAVDNAGNKVDGNAFVKRGNQYKCVNTAGNVLWFSNYNSKHLYGEAIDIINKEGYKFSDIFSAIVASDNCLQIMHDNGLSMYIESSIDSLGVNVKHFHIGTDKSGQTKFWDEVFNIRKTSTIGNKSLADYLSYSNNDIEIVNKTVVATNT